MFLRAAGFAFSPTLISFAWRVRMEISPNRRSWESRLVPSSAGKSRDSPYSETLFLRNRFMRAIAAVSPASKISVAGFLKLHVEISGRSREEMFLGGLRPFGGGRGAGLSRVS